jgi:hypothetical protein
LEILDGPCTTMVIYFKGVSDTIEETEKASDNLFKQHRFPFQLLNMEWIYQTMGTATPTCDVLDIQIERSVLVQVEMEIGNDDGLSIETW